MPKVSAPVPSAEKLAKTVEDKLRNELDRLPSEAYNDLTERIVRIQGGVFYLIEWDNSDVSPNAVGQLVITPLHPRQVVPQSGIYTRIEDMEHIIIKLPQTKSYIKDRYGVDVYDEGESEPDVRAEDATEAEALVTQYVAYYRNESGGIGMYSWVNDVEISDIEDYQARRLPRCKKCGEIWTDGFEVIAPTKDGSMGEDEGKPAKRGVCPYCGSKSFEESAEEYEQIWTPVNRGGVEIPGASMQTVPTGELDEMGNETYTEELVPVKIPFYKPDVFPVVLQRNVTKYGQLLGESDVDRISDQQNTVNRLTVKILNILLKSGSYMTVPNDPAIPLDTNDCKPWRVEDVADMTKFKVLDMTADISQLVTFRESIYEEARQQLGITDSYQGRRDTTATSGVAKEFAAQQSAGRLESKRVAKNSAWADMFEVMFKFLLAYADEPRPAVGRGLEGEREYGEFVRYDFLRQDKDGNYYYYDDLLFATDESAPLANNRSQMWQELNGYYSSGAFGDPTQTETQILFWEKMDELHYPGASQTRQYLEQKREQEQAQQAQMMAMQQEQAAEAGQLQSQQIQAQKEVDIAKALGGEVK